MLNFDLGVLEHANVGSSEQEAVLELEPRLREIPVTMGSAWECKSDVGTKIWKMKGRQSSTTIWWG